MSIAQSSADEDLRTLCELAESAFLDRSQHSSRACYSSWMDTESARDQVWQAIRTVTDPELDESIADLGFIQSVAITQPESADPSAIAGAAVHIIFRLPTYWCAANFAFMMAEDLRERIVRLPWVRAVNIELVVDHFTSDEINRGIARQVLLSRNSLPAALVEPQAAASFIPAERSRSGPASRRAASE